MDDEKIFRVREGDTVKVERSGYSNGCWGMVAGVTTKGPIVAFANPFHPKKYDYDKAIRVDWEEIIEV